MKASSKVTLNDLPKYSIWPSRLLGLEEWKQRRKTPPDIAREYEHEKWGPLLDKVSGSEDIITVNDVDDWSLRETPEIFCSLGDEFQVMRSLDAHRYYLALIEGILKPYLPASALIELGAGYGSIILSLAKKRIFSPLKIMAAEYTKAGISLIGRLAEPDNLKITVDHCDFSATPLTRLPIPENAVIFTSYATPYVPTMPVSFVQQLSKFEPKVVVHFEPCYEHCDPETVIGLMRKRYIEVNDYNRNLIALLHDRQEKGAIEILLEKKAVFGKNPLLPMSVIAWRPSQR